MVGVELFFTMEIALIIICAVIIGTFIFWLWVVKLKPFAATLMSIGTWALAGYLYLSIHFGFRATWWREYPSMRHRMVHSLVESNQLVGLKKSEVITILGPADDSLDNTIIYYTYRPGLIISLDQDALIIGFRNGIVPTVRY